MLNDISIRNTLARDPYITKKESTQALYRTLKPQEHISPDKAENYLNDLLFKNVQKYDLDKVGRDNILRKFNPFFHQLSSRKGFSFKVPSETTRNLTGEDIIVTLQYLIALNNGITQISIGNEEVKVKVDNPA